MYARYMLKISVRHFYSRLLCISLGLISCTDQDCSRYLRDVLFFNVTVVSVLVFQNFIFEAFILAISPVLVL